MALIKNKTLDTGATINYWRVDMFCKNKGQKRVNFALMGYHSKEIADNNPNAFIECIGVNDLMDSSSENKELFNYYFNSNNYEDLETACYEYAKAYIDFFKDAVDDEDEIALLRD